MTNEMKEKTRKRLSHGVACYAGQLKHYCNEHRCRRQYKGKKHYGEWQYPACCVGATIDPDADKMKYGYSKPPQTNQFHPVLLNRMLVSTTKHFNSPAILGKGTDQEPKNPLGQCAEPHAATQLLNPKSKDSDIDHILFSEAIRPRTGQVIPYCGNCRATFNATLP